METCERLFAAIGEHQPIELRSWRSCLRRRGRNHLLAWNHRDGARTCLDAETSKAIFFADSASHESRGRAAAAISLLAEAFSAVGSPKAGSFVLDQQTNDTIMAL